MWIYPVRCISVCSYLYLHLGKLGNYVKLNKCFLYWHTENLALGKPTAQSSTFSDALIGNAVSGRAVDGNPDTNMNNKHCSQTNISNPSWWRVDLGSDHVPVSQAHIVNRFSPGDPTSTSKDYEITLGEYTFI